MLSSEPSLEKRLALRLSLAVGIVVALAIAAVAYVGADIAGDIARNAAYDSTAARILGIYRRIEWIIYTMVAALAFSFVGIVRASRRAARSVVDALENHAALLHNLGSRNLRAVEGLEAMRSRGVYDHAACETAIAHLASISEVARENADITRNYSRDYHPETREVGRRKRSRFRCPQPRQQRGEVHEGRRQGRYLPCPHPEGRRPHCRRHGHRHDKGGDVPDVRQGLPRRLARPGPRQRAGPVARPLHRRTVRRQDQGDVQSRQGHNLQRHASARHDAEAVPLRENEEIVLTASCAIKARQVSSPAGCYALPA